MHRPNGSPAEYHRRQYGGHIAAEQIGAHACDIAYIITHIICNRRRVSGVIFGDARFYFPDKVGADIGRLCIDTAANTGEKCNGFCPEGKAGEDFDGPGHLFGVDAASAQKWLSAG
jgi:hypothetical protein